MAERMPRTESEELWAERFPDRWAWLNASAEDIVDTAEADTFRNAPWDPAQVGVLVALVRASRRLYELVAGGVGQEQKAEYYTQAQRLFGLMHQHMPWLAERPLLEFNLVEGRAEVRTITDAPGPDANMLLYRLTPAIYHLLLGLNGKGRDDILLCPTCNKLSERSDVRRDYCSQACRGLAYYRRERAKEVMTENGEREKERVPA